MPNNTSKIYYLDNSFQLTAINKAVYVKKVIKRNKRQYDFINKEVKWLKKLEEFDRVPDIIKFDDISITMTFKGIPINSKNIPPDWKSQCKLIVDNLLKYGVSHNDIQRGEILILDKKINLIDFQHATNTRKEFEELRNQGKTTCGSWIKDDLTQLLSEVHRILKGGITKK